jgi:NSS family neurotransmitter:Na+ symporter
MMPIAAVAIIALVLREIGLDNMENEILRSSAFHRQGVYRFVVKYLALAMLAVILISSVCDAIGLIHI